MPTRALLNLVYARWCEPLGAEDRDQLDFDLLPHREQEAILRRDRILAALEVPGAVIAS